MLNCGLSGSELYTNVPRKICKYDYEWYKEKFGIKLDSITDYLSQPFKYAFKLILEEILNTRKRFVFDFNSFYIDFETVREENFLRDRQNGRFQDVDIVNSDFKGYQLAIFYRMTTNDKNRYRRKNLYIGYEHKKILSKLTNDGTKLYTTKDFNYKSILEGVYSKFPNIPPYRLERIVHYGLYRFYVSLKDSCSINIHSKNYKLWAYAGSIYYDPIKQVKEYYHRMKMKIIRIARWNEEYSTGFHYIGIDIKKMKEWAELNNKSERAGWCWVWFPKVIARRYEKMTYYNSMHMYIFKVQLQKKYRKKLNVNIENKKYRDVEFIGESIGYKFNPATKHWKELVKEFIN